MLDYPCDYPACSARSVYIEGNCTDCCKHLCLVHVVADVHPCKREDFDYNDTLKAEKEERGRLQVVLDDLNIAETAQSLRLNHSLKPFNLNVETLARGLTNIHVPIEFDDGVKWMTRIRQVGVDAVPRLIGREILQGETATLLWLSLHGVPVPKVFSGIYTHGGTDFYFMEHVTGISCASPIWQDGASPEIVRQTVKDYAKINVARSHYPLQGVGSLHLDPNTNSFSVGPIYAAPVANPSRPYFPGPWKTAAEKWASHFDHLLKEILDGKLYADRREKAYLIHRWMKDVVTAYPPYQVEEETYVVHEDSNGGHIMVDEAGRITGLIDWEWASVGPKCEALTAPVAFLENDNFFSGSNDLCPAEVQLMNDYTALGRPDLAECVRTGKPFQWLSYIFASTISWEAWVFIRALGEAVGVEMPCNMEAFMIDLRKRYIIELQ